MGNVLSTQNPKLAHQTLNIHASQNLYSFLAGYDAADDDCSLYTDGIALMQSHVGHEMYVGVTQNKAPAHYFVLYCLAAACQKPCLMNEQVALRLHIQHKNGQQS